MLYASKLTNLPDIIHAVRYAQGISQVSIANILGVTQAAIAQYEKGRATLSFDTLKKMAPLINLNPEYITMEVRSHNPFKQRDKTQIIKMLLPENTSREVDVSLPKLIFDSNIRTDIAFLRVSDVPPEYEQRISKLKSKGFDVCAFAIRDMEGNLFLFRRRGRFAFMQDQRAGRFTTGSIDKQRIERFIAGSTEGESHYFSRSVDIGSVLFEQIFQWSEIDHKLISRLFPAPQRKEAVKFIEDLIHLLWSDPSKQEQDEKKRILSVVANAGEEYYSIVLPEIQNKLRETIRQYAGIKKSELRF